jgi:hypothetical protein
VQMRIVLEMFSSMQLQRSVVVPFILVSCGSAERPYFDELAASQLDASCLLSMESVLIDCQPFGESWDRMRHLVRERFSGVL